jgi:hypothetical protein
MVHCLTVYLETAAAGATLTNGSRPHGCLPRSKARALCIIHGVLTIGMKLLLLQAQL